MNTFLPGILKSDPKKDNVSPISDRKGEGCNQKKTIIFGGLTHFDSVFSKILLAPFTNRMAPSRHMPHTKSKTSTTLDRDCTIPRPQAGSKTSTPLDPDCTVLLLQLGSQFHNPRPRLHNSPGPSPIRIDLRELDSRKFPSSVTLVNPYDPSSRVHNSFNPMTQIA